MERRVPARSRHWMPFVPAMMVTAFAIALGFNSIRADTARPAPSRPGSAAKPKPAARPSSPRITVTRTPFRPRSPAAGKPFTRMEAWRIGIDRPNDFSIGNISTQFMWDPGSISAADIDNDGDQDVVMASTNGGILLFLNDGTGKFTRQALDLPTLAQMAVFNAAPVDLNNDGWPDLFVTTHHQGNYVLWNDHGAFSEKRMTPVKNRDDAMLALAVAFGDVDRDGFLDVVLGNHIGIKQGLRPGEEDRDRLVFNERGVLTGETYLDLPGEPGETLSLLFSDFNQDGFLDLVEANDFNQPDNYYLGDGSRHLRLLRRADGVIPVTTHTTMSVKTADLDNDLGFEIFLAQIAGRAGGVSERLKIQPWPLYCSTIEREEDRSACQANLDIRSWYRPGSMSLDNGKAGRCLAMPPKAQAECKALVVRDIAVQMRNPKGCEAIDASQLSIRLNCDALARTPPEPSDSAELNYPEDIHQQMGRNVLLVRGADGKYKDKAVAAKLDVTGWSWDVKIDDFDNDELQDVFVLNGEWSVPEGAPSKIYFSNKGGLHFEEETEKFGLADFLVLPNAAAADFDNDGDVDLVANAVNGPVVAFWNNSQQGNAIAFEFRDHVGNVFGVGNKVTIHFGPGGERHQIRELQLSGGFAAFDAPVLHYGLGENTLVDRVEIEWSTGEKTELPGPFPAGATYRIERRP